MGRAAAPLIEVAGLLLALAGLIVVFGISAEHFLSRATFLTIANQIPAAVLVAAGMTFVLIAGEIDLSVGSVMGLCGAALGVLLVKMHLPLPVAVAGCLLAGAACGLANGWIVTRWNLPSFIVTLGMLEIARGGAHLLTNSQTQYLGERVAGISEIGILGLSLPFLLALAVIAAGQFALARMVFGRYLLATGRNAEAVRFSGIDPRPIRRRVFVLSGLLAAVAAVIDTSRFQSSDPNAGGGFELAAIAAVVIGGTSLSGGRGSVVASFFGVLLIATLGAGLAALGVRDEIKRLVTGCVIVAAVILDQYRQRRWGR